MIIELPDTTPIVPLVRALATLGLTLHYDTDPHVAHPKAGDCDTCGEWAGHLIQGVCPPCLNLQSTIQE